MSHRKITYYSAGLVKEVKRKHISSATILLHEKLKPYKTSS
jgi:hypothetical protein